MRLIDKGVSFFGFRVIFGGAIPKRIQHEDYRVGHVLRITLISEIN